MRKKENKHKIKYFLFGVLTTIIVFSIFNFIYNKFKKINLDNNKDKFPAENTQKKTNIKSKELILLSKKDLEELINYELTLDSIDYFSEKLSTSEIWEKKGYSTEDSKQIAEHMKSSHYQLYGVLKGIFHNNKSLQLNLIPERDKLNIEFKAIANDDEMNNVEQNDIESNISELTLNIAYGKEEIFLNYKLQNNELIEAEYFNEITNETIKDNDIEDFINSTVLNIDFYNSQDYIINEVLNSLDLDKDFTSFKLKVIYLNDNTIEFEVNK